MAGRKGNPGCYPRRLGRPRGVGLARCNASGFVRYADQLTDDKRQGRVSAEFADHTPGFGTWHPQDVVQLGVLDDPKPTHETPPDGENLSKQDLGISDQEVAASLREGRAVRRGY